MLRRLIVLFFFASCGTSGNLSQQIHDEVRNSENRIVNGTEATFGQFPYQVIMLYNGGFRCGASVLSEDWALTAAHCVQGVDVSDLTLVCNTTSLLSDGDSHQVVQSIVNDDYNNTDLSADVAVLKVDPPFMFSDSVQPVSLPDQGQDTPAGTMAVVSGFGRIEAGGAISNSLLFAEVPIVSDSDCSEAYDGETYPSEICAAFPEGLIGVCNGDSGGPLYASGYQAGIVSWSASGCATPEYPDVYTEVSYHRDWIRENTGV